jgi:hypothetical protein
MKKSLLFLAFSVATSFGYTQTSVETLKKDLAKSKTENQKLQDENKFLNEKLNLCSALSNDTLTQIKSFSDLYTVRVASCKGDRVSQTVTIEFLVKHNTTNQDLILDLMDQHGSLAVDVLGKSYPYTVNNYKATIFTDIETRIVLKVSNILPGIEAFSIASIRMKTLPTGHYVDASNYAFTEFRNLKIAW